MDLTSVFEVCPFIDKMNHGKSSKVPTLLMNSSLFIKWLLMNLFGNLLEYYSRVQMNSDLLKIYVWFFWICLGGLSRSYSACWWIVICHNYLWRVCLSKLLICRFVLSVICHRDLESVGMLLGESYNLERRIPVLCHLHRLKFVMQLQVAIS